MQLNLSYKAIVLGPLLGVESDNEYTVCALIDNNLLPEQTCFTLIVNGHIYLPESIKQVLSVYIYLKFKFEIIALSNSFQNFNYKICYNEIPIMTRHKSNVFRFQITPLNYIPSIAFVSCNGSHSIYPADIPKDHFNGWEKILLTKPDYLIFGGDQIYADSLFRKVHDLSLYVQNHNKPIGNDLITKIHHFYLKLYIDSWSNSKLALALATIPNFMTWDDHDIFDGFGSYDDNLQNSPIFKKIFEIASIYYELFQLRTDNNTTLYEKPFFSFQLKIRNYWFICPDTRSNRGMKTVLSSVQYENLKYLLSNNNIHNTNNSVIAFVLPIPIAHRDYHSNVDKLSILFTKIFYKDPLINLKRSINDDLNDHWDHPNHQNEQTKMLNLIFEFGYKQKPKYLLILSGDVHSSGAARIDCFDENNNLTGTAMQIVSSPIVNNPVSKFKSTILRLITNNKRQIENYKLDLKNFGNFKEPNITRRNFILIYHIPDKNLNTALFLEENSNWNINPIYRNINKFK